MPHTARFWNKVDKSGACWLWTASARKGYGHFRVGARSKGSHRVSWELERGPIPEGLHVLHNCPGGDNRACVNPDHLWLGTNADNMADKVAKGRHTNQNTYKTHCKRGHEFTPENTHTTSEGWKYCRECKKLTNQQQRRSKNGK